MNRQNPRRSKPVVSHIVVKIEPGQKLLWQKSKQDSGWDLNLVEAWVQK